MLLLNDKLNFKCYILYEAKDLLTITKTYNNTRILLKRAPNSTQLQSFQLSPSSLQPLKLIRTKILHAIGKFPKI